MRIKSSRVRVIIGFLLGLVVVAVLVNWSTDAERRSRNSRQNPFESTGVVREVKQGTLHRGDVFWVEGYDLPWCWERKDIEISRFSRWLGMTPQRTVLTTTLSDDLDNKIYLRSIHPASLLYGPKPPFDHIRDFPKIRALVELTDDSELPEDENGKRPYRICANLIRVEPVVPPPDWGGIVPGSVSVKFDTASVSK